MHAVNSSMARRCLCNVPEVSDPLAFRNKSYLLGKLNMGSEKRRDGRGKGGEVRGEDGNEVDEEEKAESSKRS